MGSASIIQYEPNQSTNVINQLCLEAEILAPGTLIKRSEHRVPRVDSVWNTGSHFTHLLDSTGEMVEYRAQNPKLLAQLLSERGFLEHTPRPLLTERSALTTTWKQAEGKRLRELRRRLNTAHSEYLSEELDLESYTNQVIEFLEPGNSHDDVFGFLHSIRDSFEDRSFCAKGSFRVHLEKAFKDYKEDNVLPEQDALPLTDEAPVDEVERDGSDQLATVGYKRNRRGIVAAYKNLLEKKPYAEGELIKVVTAFAKSKVSGDKGLWDLEEVSDTADDHAQRVALSVWQQLPKFEGEPEQFYHWVNHICCTARKKAFKKTLKYQKARVPVIVEMEGDDGDMYKEDNPLIRPQEYPDELRRVLPDFIQGIDLKICNYIREGYDYEKIARVLSMTVDAVTKRVERMFKRNAEMKEGK
jgi:DNA-directed RNA polymerase specialized sigma24 family protein